MKKTLFIKRKLFLLLITCSFIQNISLAQSPPNLGAASSFALFTAVGAFSNIGAATYVTGDVGTNVGAFTAFPPGTVVGQIHVADPTSAQAATNVATAYSYLSGLTCGSVIGTTLGSGQILTPNIYCLGAASSLNGNLILDGQGNPNSLFIFKINGALSTSTFANVTLINSASLCNVYWQINGAFSLGDHSVFRGTIVADGAISLLEGSSLFGRGLSTAGAIDLHDNFVAIGMQPTATITAVGGSTTLCSGSPVTLTVSVSNGTRPYSYLWSPGGQTDSSITVSPTVTTTYTVDVTTINGCSDAIGTITVTVNPAATASANVDQTICAGSTVTLAGSIGGSATTSTWTTSGTGTFSPNATTLNATYTPSAADITAGTVTLTLTTNNPTGPCPAVNDQMIITINPAATVNANVDRTICAGSTVTLAGSIGGSATSATWTSSGSGTFSPNATTLNATYTPSATDITAGTVTLTLTSNDPAGPCNPATDQMVITITPKDNASFSYSSATFCQTGTNPTATITGLSGGTFSSTAGLVFLSTSTGLINLSASTLGTYTITYTTNGPCPNTATLILTITLSPNAAFSYAGPYCSSDANPLPTFGSGASAGVFSSTAGLVFVSTVTGQVNLSASSPGTYTVTNTIGAAGGCVTTSATNTITINPVATANANVDQTICAGPVTAGLTVTLAGSIGGSASSGTWSGGTGIFSPDANTLNATYAPSAGEITAGTVTLTLTTNDPAGPCGAVSDQMVITINPLATVDANVDQTICAGSTVTLAGSIGGGASSATWSGGTGTFSPNANTLNATYTPSAGEVTAGTLTLTLTTNDPAGPCGAVSDQMVITINHAVAVDLGKDTIITTCKNDSLLLDAGALGSSYLWSTGATTQTIYVSTTGTYYVKVTNVGGCTASDTIHVVIYNTLHVNFGPDTTVCGCILLNAYTSGATSYQWCSGGSNYTIKNVCVTGMYCVSVGNGVCTASDTINITVLQLPIVNLGNDTTITASIILTAGNTGSSFSWNTGATTQTITVNTSGIYYVTVTNTLGCSFTDTIHITAPVGINNFSGKQDFKIYPNPNNGTMQLEYYISEGTSGEFLLYDMTGRKVMKTILKGGYNQITISNGNLLDGIYLVQLISNNKIIAQNKLIINR